MFHMKDTLTAAAKMINSRKIELETVVFLKQDKIDAVSMPVVFDIPDKYGIRNAVSYTPSVFRKVQGLNDVKHIATCLHSDLLYGLGITREDYKKYRCTSFGLFPVTQVIEKPENDKAMALVVVFVHK